MKKTCSNCATCRVMKIDPKLRAIYDWSHNWPQFEGCGERFAKPVEGIFCFSEAFSNTISWKEVEKTYVNNKEKIDKILFSKDENAASQ